MRIAYLISQYPAPSHTFIRREVHALRQAGADVRTYSIRPPGDGECMSSDDCEARDETYYVLPVRPLTVATHHLVALLSNPLRYASVLVSSMKHRVPGLRGVFNALFYFGESVVLAHQLRQQGIGHLHNHFANAAANVGRLAAQQLGIPWSLTLHGISETDYPAGLMLAEKIADAKFVACVSYFGMAQAMRMTPFRHWHKMSIVRCGLNLDAMPEPCAAANARPRIICVGRLAAEKGHFGLLQAFSCLRDNAIDAKLVLVGDGPQQGEILEIVRSLRLADDVQMLGRLGEHETLPEIARSDVLVLASFMEGLPVVLMEAMALGVPVLAPRVAGVPELVEDGQQGLLFTPGNWMELASALERMLRDPDMRLKMGASGRMKITEEFQIDRSATRLLQLINDTSSSASNNAP